MTDRGQTTGALIDGPLALDNAINRPAVKLQHIATPVAGDADILLVPDLDAHMLAKELSFLANGDAAGITSRADNVCARYAVTVLYAHAALSPPPESASFPGESSCASRSW